MKVIIDFIYRDMAFYDLANQEGQKITLGNLCQNDVVLHAQVIAIVGQAPKTMC